MGEDADKALAEVRAAAEACKSASAWRNDAIRRAAKIERLPRIQIADAAKISRQRYYQIINGK